ncbi:MAG: DUF4304 domain-containing protein [Clostridia bacterium]|jgi:hypothetical protein|nr:DUF4304 domain-containing protein [Clostridia bacterium]
MKLKEYIGYYEQELDKLERHKVELLEVDKNTRHTDDKIDFTYNLLVILRSCAQTERMREKNNQYIHLKFIIEHHLQEIERYTTKNDEESAKEEIKRLLINLKEEVEIEEC